MADFCSGCGCLNGHRAGCRHAETPRPLEEGGASGPGDEPGRGATTVPQTSTPWSGRGAVRASDPAVDAVWEAWVNAPYAERLQALPIGLGDFLGMVRDAVAAVRLADAAPSAGEDSTEAGL